MQTNPTIQVCLTCYLCGNIFKKPRILPCGHTFCAECLAKLKDDIVKDGNKKRREPLLSNGTGNTTFENHTGSCQPADVCNSSVGTDADPNCYRPHSSLTVATRLGTDETYTGGLSRSCTFIRDNTAEICDNNVISRQSAPAANVCSKCGHVSSATLPRRRQSSSQSPSPTLKPKYAHPRWNTSPKRTTDMLSSFDLKHGKEMEQFVCPFPQCNYALRVMNLAKWSPKNIIVSEICAVWKSLQDCKKDACTQTDISIEQSLLVTIPRSLVVSRTLQSLGQRRRHSSLIDMAMSSTVSVEGLSRGYLPSGSASWRSYAAMLGMNILQQIVHF